jgi:hypothetical protein
MRKQQLILPLALTGVLVVAALATALAMLAPDKLRTALIAALTLPLLWGAIELLAKGDKSSARAAVIVASALLILSLGMKVAQAAQLIGPDDGKLGLKLFGIMGGVVLAFFGNRIPKMLERYNPGMNIARRQAFQRLAGWIYVLAGLASALAWLVLPIESAKLWATLIVGGSTLLVLARLVQCRLRGRRA